MKRRCLKWLLSLEEPLSSEQSKRLENARSDPGFIAEEKRLQRMEAWSTWRTNLRFDPGFDGRVIRRLRAFEARRDPFESILTVFMKEFRPLAVAALLLIVSLVSYNLIRSRRISLEAAFADLQREVGLQLLRRDSARDREAVEQTGATTDES